MALLALYGRRLGGAWRWVYVLTAAIALWFNVFVLVVQSFQKIGFLQVLAPNQTEPPFHARAGRRIGADRGVALSRRGNSIRLAACHLGRHSTFGRLAGPTRDDACCRTAVAQVP